MEAKKTNRDLLALVGDTKTNTLIHKQKMKKANIFFFFKKKKVTDEELVDLAGKTWSAMASVVGQEMEGGKVNS